MAGKWRGGHARWQVETLTPCSFAVTCRSRLLAANHYPRQPEEEEMDGSIRDSQSCDVKVDTQKQS
jgi:hypothetical protein